MLAYKRPAWAERKRRKVRAEKERSLEKFIDDGFDIPSGQALVDEIVADESLLEELYSALAELTDDERSLLCRHRGVNIGAGKIVKNFVFCVMCKKNK